MFTGIARKIFGTANDRFLKSLQADVQAINALEPAMEKLSDDALKAQTETLRARIAKGDSLDYILPEAFATVREASKRVLGMRHFDVQLVGGIVLHRGMIAEMKTGEGKTLVATLPTYLNALEGKGVHVVTVNDYLAKRDSAWMGKLHEFLGLTVGCIVHNMDDVQRQEAYRCDVTYATNNELGFDYLRDNMKYSTLQMVHRPFNFAIVDEVDSILIDEARTPLIISGPTEDNSDLYMKIDKLIPTILNAEAAKTASPHEGEDIPTAYFEKDEKTRNVTLTEEGVQHTESLLWKAGLMEEGSSLYDIANVSLVHHVNQALKAHVLFARDVDYIVKDDKVIIIDEFTGRMMEGRRFSDGLHQALEAKESVRVQNENQTLASITFQNYFRMYPKLAGMTGTAMTEAPEFRDIYNLDVIEIPTNVPVARKDEHDEIYRTADEKYIAILSLIKERHGAGQPLLVGTVSIEKSEFLSSLLKKEKIPHQVLNARYHEQEAFIIAQAGRPGAVTIATNMAGRGTDIMLGGNPEMRIKQEGALKPPPSGRGLGEGMSSSVKNPHPDPLPEGEGEAAKIRMDVANAKEEVIKAGGLYVVATERHESRRIDNQLRGRSGRQGDPGTTKFYLSLEDDLMRIFGSERIDTLLQKFGLKEGEAIFHPWMNKAIERAQSKVEQRNYEIRKNLLKFDDVMNDQRKVIYEQRIELMEAEDVADTLEDMVGDINNGLISTHIPKNSYREKWDLDALGKDVFRIYGLHIPVAQWGAEEGVDETDFLERLEKITRDHRAEKEAQYGAEIMRMAEKRLLLQTLDQLWKDHLLSLDHLRHGINLRAYAQRDPLNEYKQEAFTLFEGLLSHLRELAVTRLSHLEIRVETPQGVETLHAPVRMQESRVDPADRPHAPQENILPLRAHVNPGERHPHNPDTWGKVGRNDPCPCGSGKKFKHCHGALN